ncbi:hypothetical protein MHU86_20659 [Fragilaria crotonensis]|nr:hypothetical protein MHU86_20659 [Fragilaria crotonensis]
MLRKICCSYSLDPKNGPAGALLKTIRAKHDMTKGTPISQTLDSIREAGEEDERTKQFNILLGLLTDDDKSAPLEFGRRGGSENTATKYHKPRLAEWMQGDLFEDLRMGCLSIWLRLVLYLDPLDSQETTSSIDDNLLMRSCMSCFTDDALLPAALDVLSTWTAANRESVVTASTTEPLLHKHTESELRRLKPRDVAAIKKIEYQRLKRDKEWATRRAIFFL